MNFSARTRVPGLLARLRPRILGVTVAALVAVPLGAAPAGPPPAPAVTLAAPASSPATVTVPTPVRAVRPSRPPTAVTPRTSAAPVVASTPPAALAAGAPDVDRVPSVVERGAVLTPPASHPSTLARSQPTRLRIPAIAVDSELVGLGLQDDGRMEVPRGAFPAGWYTGAPTPGELGPAILAGHVDYGGTAGVFSRLRQLAPGDPVEVVRADGTTAVFRVTRVEQHPKDAFPTAAVYGDIDHAGLRLITCGGAFDRNAHSYEDNIVVFAELHTGS